MPPPSPHTPASGREGIGWSRGAGWVPGPARGHRRKHQALCAFGLCNRWMQRERVLALQHSLRREGEVVESCQAGVTRSPRSSPEPAFCKQLPRFAASAAADTGPAVDNGGDTGASCGPRRGPVSPRPPAPPATLVGPLPGRWPGFLLAPLCPCGDLRTAIKALRDAQNPITCH